MWTSGFCRYEHSRNFKTFLKKIVQSLWIVVTYLLKNVENAIKYVLIVLMEFA